MSDEHRMMVGVSYVEQPLTLCDYLAHGGDDANSLVEGFVGAVWSGQIKSDKRIVS